MTHRRRIKKEGKNEEAVERRNIRRKESFYENREKLDSFFGTFLWHFLVSC